MDKDQPGTGVREQNTIISSPRMAERIHTVANTEGSMRALEHTLTEVEGMGRRGRTGREESEARLLEGLQELLLVVSLDLAKLEVLSGVLLSRTC